MKQRKNIDNLFNEGLKNIEATPSPRVWKNIQAQLQNEKGDRKVIPLWMKLGGVAALLAVLFFVGNLVFSPSLLKNPSITNEDVIKTEKEINRDNSEFGNEANPNETQIASEENIPQNGSSHDLNVSGEKLSEEKTQNKSLYKTQIDSSQKSNSAVVASNESDKSDSQLKDNSAPKNDLNEGVAISKNPSDESHAAGRIKSEENKMDKDRNIFSAKKEVLAVVENSEKDSSKKNPVKTEEEVAEDSKNKKSIFDAIAENTEENLDEITKKQKPEHRWNVAPNVAPVYYSSLGNGSSIDPSFADNPQKGDVNMSYGVQVSYALNNRLSIRTGLNNVDLSYSTSGIEVGTAPVAVALRSVDYGNNDVVLTAVDKGSLSTGAPSNSFGNITPKSTQGDARLIQNINYYEVPLELKYAVVESKLGLNIIGGVSTMFLGNNEISVKADNFNSVLGEANNLSSVSFSTNVGLGLDYKLSKKFTFNIEPMFKYQLNPYTDSSVNFKPYYLGVYSGFSFKF